MPIISLFGALALCVVGFDTSPVVKAPTPIKTKPTTAAIKVTIQMVSDVSGNVFTLGEIAQITGEDKGRIAQLAAVEIGTSPLPGLNRLLYTSDILTHLRAHNLDSKDIDLVFPPSIRVTRIGNEVPPDAIVNVAREALPASGKDDANGITFDPQPISARWFISKGKCEYQAGLPRGSLDGGVVIVPVSILVDGKLDKSVEVVFKVRHTVPALVASHPLGARTVLTADDVTIIPVDLTPGMPAPIIDLKSVIGKRTTRSFAKGAMLTIATVESVPVITVGMKVTLEIVVGGIRISAPAIARNNGAIGETICVFSTTTNKELSGIVIDSETVRVEEK